MSKLLAIHQQNNAVMGERNGVTIPMSYGNAKAEHLAVRKHILLTDYSHVGIASISGDSAWEVLNLLVAGDVSSIRDEQAMYTLILNEEGDIVTDLYVLCDEERFLLFSEWMSGEQMCGLIRNILADNEDEFDAVEAIEPLSPEWGTLHIEGPYCWELLTELYGMDVIGLPYQEHMHIDDLILLRGGKHGEFSYKLMGTRDNLAEAWQQLQEAGEKYDMRTGGLNYQKQVRLENPCWEPHVFNDYTRCPIELQMQWAVRYDKDRFVGLDAISARLEQGIGYRTVGMTISGKPANVPQRGDKVTLNGEEIGEVIACGYSDDLKSCVGRVYLKNELAWANIEGYQAQTAGGPAEIHTAAIPFARNYSFLVNPSEHSYVDPDRPSNLLQQMEWQAKKDSAE